MFLGTDRAMTPPGSSSVRRPPAQPVDLVCLSHLRWNFVFQRPQHLMTAGARDRKVLFFEEPVRADGPPRVVEEHDGGVTLATPQLPADLPRGAEPAVLRALLDRQLDRSGISRYILWYYTPMARVFSRHLRPAATVYDCMDELSAFAHAPRDLRELEAELLEAADLVFTGGQSLYEAKQHLHPSVHAFPSSVDVRHFAQARTPQPDPSDQVTIPRPRLGFFGVIDERLDRDLLDGVAAARPSWQLVMVGPIAKIERSRLPARANIHYLGRKSYEELPAYLAGWDVALLPFARNDATRYISPTKTPEYLAAGKPVVSTSIRDVMRPYGQVGLVRIADRVEDFIAAVEAALAEPPSTRPDAVDTFLRSMSWERTWQRMLQLVGSAVEARLRRAPSAPAIDRSAGPTALRPSL